MPAYDAPGHADQLSAALLAAWNQEISDQFDGIFAGIPDAAPFLLRHPDQLGGGSQRVAAHWFGDPAEPRFCLDPAWAQKLSDWGVRGRHSFHNEYFEFGVDYKVDAAGRMRPKQFIASTELPEYWITLAKHDPQFLQATAEAILGRGVALEELYGASNPDPSLLSPQQRLLAFATEVAGNCNNQELMNANIPRDPVGALNTKNVLFMSHPINGLDDLIYIIAFGAQPYAVDEGGALRRALLHEIFRQGKVTHLACRNADPAAAQAAYDTAVREVRQDGVTGRVMAFADPLGMYIQTFTTADFTYQGQPVPGAWVKLGRGTGGLYQRLEFGPPDGEDIYLDDIAVEEVPGQPQPLSSGYLVAKRVEVGPYLNVGAEIAFNVSLVPVTSDPAPLVCSQASICKFVVSEKTAYEKEHSPRMPRM